MLSNRQITTAELIRQGILAIGDGYRAKNSELSSSGLPFARAGNINNGFQFEGADRFPAAHAARLGDKVSCSGDVVLTSKGTVGRFAYVRSDTPEFVYSPQLCYWRSLDKSIIHPRFLYYWINGSEFWDQAAALKGQTDMADYISLTDQRSMRITLLPIHEQRAIAHILGTLDDKIELNRKMNETLEAMARATFKSWFIDFDPVHAKVEGRHPDGMDAETAGIFPDTFQISECGKIPLGWRWLPLSDAVELNPSRCLERGVPAPYVEMSRLPTRGSCPSGWPLREAGSGSRFRNGDSLLARITPCLENGKTGFVDFLSEGEVGWGSTEYIVICPRLPFPSEWGYLLARYAEFRDFAAQKMEGTSGRQRVSTDAIGRYLVAVPTTSVGESFGRFVRPLFRMMSTNFDESRNLSHLRDALLPKLLSGKIRVQEAEKVLEAVL